MFLITAIKENADIRQKKPIPLILIPIKQKAAEIATINSDYIFVVDKVKFTIESSVVV